MITEEPTTTINEQIKRVCDTLDAKKAARIKVLNLGDLSSVTDYYVIAEGTSQPHLRALVRELEKTLKESGFGPVQVDANPESGWVVLDAYDFMVHLFLPESRTHYGLETLWADAPAVEVPELLSA